MSFISRNWTDRNAVYPGRRLLKPVIAGDFSLVDIENADGGAYPGGEGQQWNAANMNDLENRISSVFQSGTFTPSVNNNSGLTRLGTYYKIGNLCFITVKFEGTMAAISTQIQITGLPFASFSDDEQHIESGYNSGFNTNDREFGIIAPNSTTVRMYIGTNSMTHPTPGAVVLRLCGVYRTAN